jgi:fused-like protein
MTWNEILNHPFVKGRIMVLEEDIPESPFTHPLTASQSREKQKQAHKIIYGDKQPVSIKSPIYIRIK